MSNSEVEKRSNGRNPFFIFGGFMLLGLVLALLLFGGSLFGGGDEDEAPVLQQVPQLGGGGENTAVIPNNGAPLEVGNIAYDFTLKDLEGNSHTLSELRGQPVIINFWATWCAPCRIEMPELQAAFERYADDDLMILALDNDESADAVRAFFYDEMDLTFTPLLDDGSQVAELYGVFNFPSTFFVNADGEITAIHRGPMVESQIDGYMAETLTEG